MFFVVFRTRQYTICYSAVRTCVYTVRNADMTDTSGHVTKEDQRAYVKIETLLGPLSWTPMRGKCCLTLLILQTWVSAMKLKELFRGCSSPILNDLNLPMTRHIWELKSNGLHDGIKKLPDCWKCVIKAMGTTLNNKMWKLTRMNKFDWFLAVCALLLKWTSCCYYFTFHYKY